MKLEIHIGPVSDVDPTLTEPRASTPYEVKAALRRFLSEDS
jgi:hypothetical protein